MAAFEDLVAQQGPRMPEVSGAPPAPRQPAGFPNPPSVASAPVGRPPAPSTGFGAALPVAGGPSGPPPAPPRAAQTGTSAPAPAAAPVLPGTQEAAAAGPIVLNLDHVPNRAELATLPPGARVVTPYGEMTSAGDLIPNPTTMAAYQQAVIRARQDFGPTPFSGDPKAPQPPIKLGRSYINPFTGRWGRAR